MAKGMDRGSSGFIGTGCWMGMEGVLGMCGEEPCGQSFFRIFCSSDFLRRQAFLVLGDQSYEPSTCLFFSIIHGGCSYPRGRLISSTHQWISIKKAGKLVMGIFPK